MDPFRIRAAIIDSQPQFLDIATAYLRLHPAIEVAGCFTSAMRGLAAVDRLDPHVVLVDLALAAITGFELTRRIKASGGKPHVVILTPHQTDWTYQIVKLAGADAFLSKSRFAEDLPSILLTVFDV